LIRRWRVRGVIARVRVVIASVSVAILTRGILESNPSVFGISLTFLFGFKVRSSQGHGAHQSPKKYHDPLRFSHFESPFLNSNVNDVKSISVKPASINKTKFSQLLFPKIKKATQAFPAIIEPVARRPDLKSGLEKENSISTSIRDLTQSV